MFRLGFLGVLVVSGILLAARAVFGSFEFPVHVNSPMNLEGLFALAFLALALTQNKRDTSAEDRGSSVPLAVLLSVIVFVAFAGSLDFPLLADDYIHIWNARHATAETLWAHFTVPEPDHFFRPLVYCSYALDALWAGLAPLPWRAGNLALHILNTLLVFALCRTLGLARLGSFAGALIFGLHGSRPEAVTWVAARFDLLAVTFGCACILSVVRGARWWVGCLFLALALMSKESAYVVPLLVAVALWYRRSEILKPIAPLLGVTAVALAYRLWLLQGIGGYRDASDGSAVALHFGLASTLNGLLPRFWAAMMFPLNWTGGLSRTAAIFLVVALLALVYLALQGLNRRKAILGVAMAFLCALPVHQFLLIGSDLEKSRVLYFATVGLAVLFAGPLERTDWKVALCGLALAGFQWTALENNLSHWRHVGDLAGRTCAAGAEAERRTHSPIVVAGLPNVIEGVYFLHMGFPECVKFMEPSPPILAQQAQTYRWDPQSQTLR